jgi:UDP-N-acetylmuramate dehydrogenase
MLKDNLLEKGSGNLKGKFISDVSMKPYTTIRAGGKARGVYFPENIEALKQAVFLCRRNRTPLSILGNGSNIIISDGFLKNIFVKMSSPFFSSITVNKNNIICGAGVIINRLCSLAQENKLSGAEFLTGIPATVGGAVFCNAGAYSQDIAGILKSIECLDSSSGVRHFNPKDIGFGYRRSGLKGSIILSVVFSLKKAKSTVIREKTNRYLERRIATQDYTAPSAGCVFKNPDVSGMSAGEMIDRCGLKGKRIGDACVSRKHANFIINKGKATAEDIYELVCFIQKKVRLSYGITLETEVEFIK